LALTNEYAINGHENRISYVVGAGHSYLATPRKHSAGTDQLAAAVQDQIERFVEENRWHSRQQEIVRRIDRDGEVFLRTIVDDRGELVVRFIEPEQVATPPQHALDPAHRQGVVCARHDAESVVGYWVDGTMLPGEVVQHRRANVDANVRRGLPLYTPVRKNLRRAEKLLRNMSVVAEVQSAIALVRKHRSGSRQGVETFVARQSESTREHRLRYAPGTILDAPAGLEYDFPAAGIDAGNFVTILQAELRAIAARLVMPEFMFTSDASNASYSSTMIAEGPAVRMFERLQHAMAADDRALLWRVVDHAVARGLLPRNVRQQVDIQVTPPPLVSRDALREAQVDAVAHRRGILSPQTWSQRLGLDYDQEQKNLAMHNAKS
jgi:capsid protein